MQTTEQLDQTAAAISNAIVELVERTDGPVTFARIEREIPGFAGRAPLSCSYTVDSPEGEILIWAGMTQAGGKALRDVLRGYKVTIQFVALPLHFALEECFINNDNWWPAVLLPARAANLRTDKWLMRASSAFQKYSTERGVRTFQPLTPGPVGFTADQFAAP
jgi:hypothetical protein